ncbi:thiol:disulfide interchange protein DsbG [Acidithiobacillus ferrivorans]|nr:thiol:disulfide interchange protein DsbG [Acidithiobacillus ferrivorans]
MRIHHPFFPLLTRGAVVCAALAAPLPALAQVTCNTATSHTCSVATTATTPSTLIPHVPAGHKTTTVHDRYAAGRALIEKLSNGQSKILHAFPAAMGLDGFAVEVGGSGRDVLMYTSQNGKYFLVGGIFNAAGHNLSKQYAQKYLPAASMAPAVSKPADLLQSMRHTTWFTVGNPAAKKHVWIVMDPNCIFCHKTWEAMLPYINKGDILLHVTLVGFLKHSSPTKAATILMNKNPAQALLQNEKAFNDETEEGATVPSKLIPKTIQAEVSANSGWMSKNGLGGTPFVIWKGVHGKVHAQAGEPPDMQAFVESVGVAK